MNKAKKPTGIIGSEWERGGGRRGPRWSNQSRRVACLKTNFGRVSESEPINRKAPAGFVAGWRLGPRSRAQTLRGMACLGIS